MTQPVHITLFEALNQDDDKQFRYILETEGLPRGTNWLDYDLLTKALRQKSKRIAAYLLEKRCRVMKNDDTTQLNKVVEKYGWGNIVERLLTLESKVTDVNDKGDTVLHLAFVNHFPEFIIDLLLRHYMHETTVNVMNRDGLSFLHIACTRPNKCLAQEFLETGKSDVHNQVSLMSNSIYSGYTALHFAVEHGRFEVVKSLLQYNADIYAIDFHGSTPLHLALEHGDKRIIDILCYHDNRNENYINKFGLSHFMAACASSDSLIADQYLYIAEQDPLISAGGLIRGRVKNVNEYTYACYTPLHFAAEFGRLDTVKLLLAHGANCCAVTNQNLTPTDLACRNEHMEICSLLLQHSCGCKAEVAQKTADEILSKEKIVNQSTVKQSVKEDSQVAKKKSTTKKDVDLQLTFAVWYFHAILLVFISIITILMFDFNSFMKLFSNP
ncbi:ankyrin-1-like [Phymastichus coffea]|uniref:ankyrin-1-like n=1 Tax=Phymastichus coffea TaxID=108790 RepID=UPI00273BFB16|nr:ankyrin-1-like [Phymastichus coffea]